MSRVEQVAGEALTYLAETDESCAQAKAHMEGLKYRIKTVLAQQILNSKQSSHALSKSEAEASQEYQKVTEDYKNSVLEYETLHLKRQTQFARWEWARSLNSNRRQAGGNL